MSTRYIRNVLRAQPVQALLGRVAPTNAVAVADVGCGKGAHIAPLRQRFPSAKLVCIDEDRENLQEAMHNCIDSHVSYVHQKVGAADDIFDHDDGINIVFCNTVLHMIPDHQKLVPDIWERLPAGGVLAAQMPLESPFNAALRKAVSGVGGQVDDVTDNVLAPAEYHELLSKDAESVDCWVTHHYHAVPMDELSGLVEFLASETGTVELPTDPAKLAEVRKSFNSSFAEEHTLANGKCVTEVRRLYFVATKRGAAAKLA